MIMQDCTLVEIQTGPQFLFLALVEFSTVSSPRIKSCQKQQQWSVSTEKSLKISAWCTPMRFALVATASAQKGPGLVKRRRSG